MWSEAEARYGSSEVISCIHVDLDSVKPEKKTSVSWFASCGCHLLQMKKTISETE
jgi:hypothetical protein